MKTFTVEIEQDKIEMFAEQVSIQELIDISLHIQKLVLFFLVGSTERLKYVELLNRSLIKAMIEANSGGLSKDENDI